jgi:hypothetical protein
MQKARQGPGFFANAEGLARVIHFELNWVSCHV